MSFEEERQEILEKLDIGREVLYLTKDQCRGLETLLLMEAAGSFSSYSGVNHACDQHQPQITHRRVHQSHHG